MTTQYTANSLNQYVSVKVLDTNTGQGLKYDEDGNLIKMYLGADIEGDGDVDEGDMAALVAAYGTCEDDPGYDPDADLNGDGCVDQADLAILLGLYGTTITDQVWADYTWDCENRLIAVTPAADPNDLTVDIAARAALGIAWRCVPQGGTRCVKG